MSHADLTAILDEYKADATGIGPVCTLVAALEAVLKPHQPGRIVVLGALCQRHENHRHFSITSKEAADVRACADCQATVYVSCTGCDTAVPLDSCPVRTAVARALTGEDDPGPGGGETYHCAACDATIGIFTGHGPDWRHYRGDGTSENPVVLYDAGHEAVPGGEGQSSR